MSIRKYLRQFEVYITGNNFFLFFFFQKKSHLIKRARLLLSERLFKGIFLSSCTWMLCFSAANREMKHSSGPYKPGSAASDLWALEKERTGMWGWFRAGSSTFDSCACSDSDYFTCCPFGETLQKRKNTLSALWLKEMQTCCKHQGACLQEGEKWFVSYYLIWLPELCFFLLCSNFVFRMAF